MLFKQELVQEKKTKLNKETAYMFHHNQDALQEKTVVKMKCVWMEDAQGLHVQQS